jgi:hypothetical protein
MSVAVIKQIWWDGSSTTCVEHMGFTLKSEVEARPRKKSHITCFGYAYLMDSEEVKAIQAIMESEVICESCAYEAGIK